MNGLRNGFVLSLAALLVSLSSGVLWAAEPKDPLVELTNIADKMGDAQSRLADGKAGADTLKLQAEIITALDRLIDLAEENAKPKPRDTRCPTCRKKSTPCKECGEKNGTGQGGKTPATRPGDRQGGPADGHPNDPNDASNPINLRPKYGEPGRRIDEEEMVPGFEELLERFFKIIGDLDQEEK